MDQLGGITCHSSLTFVASSTGFVNRCSARANTTPPGGRERPNSIDDKLELSEETGTHSILDVSAVAEQPAPGFVASLSRSEIIDAFGNERPTRLDVERAAGTLDGISLRRGRWTGSYVVLYQRDVPTEIFFFGRSGD